MWCQSHDHTARYELYLCRKFSRNLQYLKDREHNLSIGHAGSNVIFLLLACFVSYIRQNMLQLLTLLDVFHAAHGNEISSLLPHERQLLLTPRDIAKCSKLKPDMFQLFNIIKFFENRSALRCVIAHGIYAGKRTLFRPNLSTCWGPDCHFRPELDELKFIIDLYRTQCTRNSICLILRQGWPKAGKSEIGLYLGAFQKHVVSWFYFCSFWTEAENKY